MRRWALAGCAAVALIGCGGGSSTDGLLSASALPEMHSTTSRLDATGLAQSTPIRGLAQRLDQWGLRRAAAREFTGVGGPLDHVVSRTAEFEDADGAAAYVRTLVARRDAYLGPGADARRVAGGWILRQPACGCHPQPPTLIELLRHGAQVHWLSVSGRAATVARARGLATHLL